MYAPGHAGIALLCVTPLAIRLRLSGYNRTARLTVLGFLLTASAPDVDLYLASVPHRGITHTLLAAAAVGVVFGLVAATIRLPSLTTRPTQFGFGFLVGMLGISTHLVGDVITPMGIQPFAPLLDAHYTLDLVYAADPAANTTLLVAGLAVYGLSTEVPRVLGSIPTETAESTASLRDADAELN